MSIPSLSKSQWLFSPQSIPGLALWLDGADLNSMVRSGTTVTQWNDKSGYGNNTSATGSPTSTGAGVVFPGTGIYFNLNTPFASTHTVFIVATTSSTSQIYLFGRNFPGAGPTILLNYVDTSLEYYDNGSSARTTLATTTTPTYIASYIRTLGTDGTVVGRYNGAQAFTEAGPTSEGNGMNWGYLGAASPGYNYYTGTIYEFMIFNTALTTVQAEQVEGYLAWKWGLQSTLPVTHPYGVSTSNPTFNPTDITGCQLWLDGADASSMTLDGTTVSQWNDKSGNARNATILSGYNGATYSSTYNCLYFPNSTTGYETTYTANPNTETMFVVFNNPSPSFNNNMVIGGPQGARSLSGGFSGSGPGVGAVSYLDNEVTWGGIATMPAGTYASGTTVVITGTVDGSSTSISQNGGTTYTGSGTAFNFSSVNTYIGTDTVYSPPNYYYIGYIMEIIFYDSVLSVSQRQQVESYLGNKWGITGLSSPALRVTTPPFSRLFQPMDISGCQLWLDAADTTTLFQDTAGSSPVTANAQVIQRWRDKSGQNNNATTSDTVMTYNSSVFNGNPGITFNGTQTYGLTCPLSFGSASPFSIFIIVNQASGFAGPIYTTSTTTDDNGLFLNYGGSDTGGSTDFLTVGSSWVTHGSSTIYANTPYILSIVSTSVNGGTITLYVNGTYYMSGTTTGNFSWNILSLGKRNIPGYNDSFAGSFGEFILFDSAFTTSQQQQVEAYLAWKWNLKSLLTSTHYGYRLPAFTNGIFNSTIFTPKSVPGCLLWLDAADRSAITFSSGPTVSLWKDKSGNGNDGTPNTGVSWDANGFGTGLPAMTFTNSQWFQGNISITSNQYTAFCVFNMNSGSSSYARVLSLAATGQYDFNNNAYICIPRLGGNILSNYRSGTYPAINIALDSNEMITSWVDGSSSYLSQYGGDAATTGSSGNFAVSQYSIGSEVYAAGDTSSYLYGYVAEVIIYNTALTTPQRQQVEGYLAWKWGLQSSLPDTHAYKSFKP